MAEGRERQQWVHTAHLICIIFNVNRAKGDPLKFRDVYPFKDGVESGEEISIDELKKAWIGAS